MAKKKPTAPTPANQVPVSFRLPDEAIAAELSAQAKAAGKSPSLFARDLVIGSLLRPDELAEKITKLTGQLNGLEETLRQVRILRGDLATSVNILLAAAGQLSPEEAKAWVEANLLKQR